MNNKKEIQNLIDTFYDIISGKAGQERDWEKFRTLFYQGAHLIPNQFTNKKKCITTPYDIDSYINRLSDFLQRNDFYEYGFDYDIEIYGNISHVYSLYEAKNCKEGNTILKRGRNLVQLINTGYEWKIINMLWEDV